MEKNETCLKCRQVIEDNNRAWQKVALLEARLAEAYAECSRLAKELARTYE